MSIHKRRNFFRWKERESWIARETEKCEGQILIIERFAPIYTLTIIEYYVTKLLDRQTFEIIKQLRIIIDRIIGWKI